MTTNHRDAAIAALSAIATSTFGHVSKPAATPEVAEAVDRIMTACREDVRAEYEQRLVDIELAVEAIAGAVESAVEMWGEKK